jgi:ABC-type transport system involved in multi-copper enzyme maturation permease subunit
MPIHDHGYARYAGSRRPFGRAWAVIAGAGIRNMLSARPFLFVLLFAWLQFFVRAVMFYLAANVPQADVIAPSAATFREFFDQQGFFVFVVAVYAGTGLIANDRRANALQIYLSKPLTRVEYIVGKLAVVMAFLALVTWVPAILLLVLQTMFTGNLAFVREHVFLIPAITIFGFLQVLLASITMLALSSLSTSARYVGMLYAGAVIFSEAVFQTLRGVTGGGTGMSWVSFSASLAQVGDVIFRVEPRYDTPWGVSLAAVTVVIAMSAWVLARRVRGVEIVT